MAQKQSNADNWTPVFSRWRHGGWYVSNLHYPGGACGCVSNNYPDKKWRIACDDRRSELGGPGDFTFPSRDAAARAERDLVASLSSTKPRNAIHLLADDVDYRDVDVYVSAGGEADWLITVTLNKADGSISEGTPRYSANDAEAFEEHPEMVMPTEVRAEFDRLKPQAIAMLQQAEQETEAAVSQEVVAEVLPGAVRQEIASVQMSDIVGDYDTPDEVPEWTWVEKESSFSHRENGQSGVWEFVLNLSRHFESIPAKLIPVIQNAREANFAYLIFHQGT